MKIKELFGIICPEEYKNITIETEDIINSEDINGKLTMAFSVLNEEERGVYEASVNKQDFIGSSESIKVYNVEVGKFYCLIKDKDDSGLYNIVMKKLQKYCNTTISAAYVLVTHMLLHELGHYQQYIERNKNVYDYTSWNEKEERENYYKRVELNKQIQDRIDKKILPYSPNKYERIQLMKLNKEYRNIPKEREADKFAYARMEEAIRKLSVFFD